MSTTANQTPMMKQFWENKSLHPDKILLYRMGDFFEMFMDDAVKAAPILGIALTSRNKKGGDETPMCGVPYHSIAGPINRLLSHGLKVAICDQIEDPKTAKGLVKRAVTRVLTPGMVYDLESLEAGRANYLASVDESHVALTDTSTGESFYFFVENLAEARRILDLIPVAELVLDEKMAQNEGWTGVVSIHVFEEGAEQLPPAARRLLSYIRASAGDEALRILKPFESRSWKSRLHLSPTVLRHLEIFQTYKGEGIGSLFHAVDRTQTSIGRRLLRQWLSFPLTEEAAISDRQNGVQAWRAKPAELKRVRQALSGMGDLERRLGKMPHATCNARDLQSLGASVEAGLAVVEMAGFSVAESADLRGLAHLAQKIQDTLVEEPPLQVRQGHLIRKGLRADLDELIELSTNAQALLMKMEADEREKTGIASLKIRYNNVFGYYIEITNTHKDKAPARYQRKQTLANAERYCTDELLELERKVLSAQTRRSELEYEIFEALRREILNASQTLLRLAQTCAEIDVLSALAWLSLEENYARPRFHHERSMSVKSSRHPVVEQSVRKEFVPNDIEMGDRACMLLTGPNMAGKSTLMRQVALTAILAQIGSDVPARDASLPIFDAVYTRIGASDQLSEGLSTFMVEMVETSQMLKSATGKSLVVLDEVGRGTSTYDGMCLAQSILEHLLSETRCLTLFATHYHELTVLETLWPQVQNAHMSVTERGGEVRFLHTLMKGPALKSYGIQVAELAGLPSTITRRAKTLLKEVESRTSRALSDDQLSLLAVTVASADAGETTTMSPQDQKQSEFLRKMSEELRELPISKMTPLEALNRLAQWQETWRDPS